ncbi:MAG: helix-turn-helix transcriptional regulator [Clostridiales bacterium]|nr:helix-turn-helix transcriptional regulator [Clostridiales bacterium]
MYKHKLEQEIRCPLEYGLNIFGGKWKARIICVLSDKKTLRYGEIRKELINITDTVLTATLKEMIADKIIERKQYNVIPPKVEYKLTAKGLSIIPILQSICQWSAAYNDGEDNSLLTKCKSCEYNS